MFTPQKLLSLTPKRWAGSGSRTDLGPNSAGEGTATGRGKGVAIFEAKTPASGSAFENGDDGVVGSGGATMDREVLVQRVAGLEKELYEYQFNMGLLLIEKKEWNSKYKEISQDLQEVRDALEQEKAAHLIAISEAEKREESLRKALGVEKECVLDLEKALREMRAEHAAIKFTADSKLAEANALVASVEDKSLEVEAKLRAADAKLAEMSRKSLEMDRKSRDLEAQESALRRERLSFIAEREMHESTLSKQREDLREWEKKLQEGEERLAKGQRILNEREQRANESDRILRQKEKELEDTQKNIDATNVTLRSKEDDEYDSIRMNLDLKEKELSAWEEKLNDREKTEIQKLLEEHKAMLDLKKQEFEVELEEKRISSETGLQNRSVELEKKEAEINHMEEKVAKRELALEKRTEKLREKEKEYELKLKGLKEREKSIKFEEKNLEKEKGQVESEREKLLSIKADIDKIKADNEQELLRIQEETNRLKVTEEERSDYMRLQSELKHEIDQYRLQKELLLKETDDLRQQKETFERDWEELDLKRADVEKELKKVVEQKEEISKLQQIEEEKLKNEKQATEDYIQRELEALKLAKESFAIQMEDEKSDLAEKSQSERNQMLLDFEMRKREFEADMQNQLEQKENEFLERKKLFEEERERELSNINYLREVAHREMEEMKLQRSKLEKEKLESVENKKHLEKQQAEMREDIDVLVDLNRKLKGQREQFVEERRRFIDFVEKLRSCQNCGEIVSEFVLSGLQSLAEIENVEVPSLPKLADDIIQGSPYGNLASRQNTGVSPVTDSKSPVSGGTMSWLHKCTSKIFKISPGTKMESEDVGASRDVAPLSIENDKIEESSGGILGTENEAEVSFAIVSDSFVVQRTQSDNDVREIDTQQDISIDDHSNIDSKAPEVPEDSQLSDSKGGQQKPRKRGKPRVKRTRSVKAVVKDAKAILGESVDDDETEFANGNAEDSANVNSTMQKQSKRMPSNARKRNHVQTSQMTTSQHDGDASEGRSDSEVQGQHKRRRQKAAPPVRESRYNLRRPKAGAAAPFGRALSGSKESEGEVDRIKETDDAIFHSKTSSPSRGVTNENRGQVHIVQSEKIVEIQDGYGETRNAVNNTVLSEEVNGTPDDAEEHDAEYRSESCDVDAEDDNEEDEEYEHPGEASIGKKLWTFFTT
ncbi:protein CROWDED NUCLEI 1 [Senna tora]|uniref:Protein CROWDED NUCLEI 1 n=1 Tax=Senna tora TaxID=362788 RepID=A0A834W7H1_9FABA|nr:protein CROWDED NUCLEI 1 [Senna tora]